MRRHTKGSVLDLSIRGDELENRRIQLEHDLRHAAGELSFRLSSVSDDEDGYHNQSVEYPRRNSGTPSFPSFASYEHVSRDHFDDSHSQIHPYSYRSDDDGGGIDPYIGGETMSTVAHHASALTLSAGLGGQGMRRDISLSGAEYDPDRPLQAMIAGADSKLSMFDIEPSRSRYPGVSSVTYDPLVVDTTAELDRILQSGYAVPSNHTRIHPPLQSSSSSSSDSEHAENRTITRPKLSDSLHKNVTLSKRPRSAQSNPSEMRSQLPIPSPPFPLCHKMKDNERGAAHSAPRVTPMPMPKPKKRAGLFPSHSASPGPSSTGSLQVRLHPPAPPSANSQFSKKARGLMEIQQEQQVRKSFGPTGKYRAQTPRGKVHLPDMTGLTSAVESPAKMGIERDYYPYRADDSPREIEARLNMTLNTVQSKLQQLEEENGISRRRIRELEMELDICKRDVTRERTRVLEREEIIVQQQRDLKRNIKGKSKAPTRDISINVSGDRDIGHDLVRERYKEAVEEKKALEALIMTLRSHLTRLTSELSSHKEILMSLRELRESDVRTLNKKSEEIEKLKEEVERLGGEIEVLRGVVEEGLKERREGREAEAAVGEEEPDLAISSDVEDVEEENEHRMEASDERRAGYQEEAPSHQDEEGHEGKDNEGEEDFHDEEPIPFDPASIQGSSRNDIAGREHGYGFADKTMRTDRATLGSSKLAQSTTGFIDPAECGGTSVELEEQRSHHSYGNMPSRSPSPVQVRRATVQTDTSDDDDGDEETPRTTRSSSPPRPIAPTPARVQESTHLPEERRVSEMPFPQIRGGHLERLFFSAPEHNERTCNVCRRRTTGGYQTAGEGVERNWIPSKFRQSNVRGVLGEGEDEDEGFAEGSDHQYERERRHPKGKRPQHDCATFLDTLSPGTEDERWRQQAKKVGLPPQTVVARVIREFEDDFTHYKGIYVELADQYKVMDAVSDVPRRNVLARHLKEVVDILEHKGDQIASLYDLLTFKDKDVSESVVPGSKSKLRSASTTAVPSSSIGRKAGAAVGRQPSRLARGSE